MKKKTLAELFPPKPKPSAGLLELNRRAVAAGVPAELINLWSSGKLSTEDLMNLIEECADKARRRTRKYDS